MPQTYANHAHRPDLTIAAFVLTIGALGCFGLAHFGYHTHFWGTGCLFGAILCLIAISRRYTTRLQDRIILLEMRVRGDEVLTPSQRQQLWTLSTPQIMAVRFASDAEIGPLVERAVAEKMSPKDIKQAVRTWRADLHRT